MNSWWNCVAKDVNRHPSAVTKPPSTAVTLVLFLRQNATVTGDIINETPVDIDPSHPATYSEKKYCIILTITVCAQYFIKLSLYYYLLDIFKFFKL